MKSNKVNLQKVQNWYIGRFVWYEILLLFMNEDWVDGELIKSTAACSVSTATTPLKRMGFKFKKRIIRGNRNQRIATEYRLKYIPPKFKNTKA